MKIACIAASQIPSSTANSIQVMKVCNALVQVNHQLRLWVPGGSENPWSDLKLHYGLENEFQIQWLPIQQRLRKYDLAFNAVQQALTWGAELIYTWMSQAAVWALLRKAQVILEIHDMPGGRLGPHLFRQFIRQKGKKRLLAITYALYNKLQKEYRFNFKPGEIQIAPNGTDLEQYADLPDAVETRRLLRLPEGMTIGYTGHFYSGRGIELMLKLIPEFPQINFMFVGGQPEKVSAWQAVLQQKQMNNAYATGFIENAHLPMYQAAADILLMPYDESIEGSSGGNSAEICSPMKMFDYLAAGRVILASDLPVLHEVLNENNAVFCETGDLTVWKEVLEELMADPARRKRLSEQARKDAARYTWRQRAEHALEGFVPIRPPTDIA